MAGSPEISVDVTRVNDDDFTGNTYSIRQAIATGTFYPSETGSIEVKIINGKNGGDDIRHLIRPQLTLSFQVMNSDGSSKEADPPTGWESWFYCAFNDSSEFSDQFKHSSTDTSEPVLIKANSQNSLDLSKDSDKEKACLYGTVKKDGTTDTPTNEDRTCTMKFRIKPASSTGAGNYQYILKIAGTYT